MLPQISEFSIYDSFGKLRQIQSDEPKVVELNNATGDTLTTEYMLTGAIIGASALATNYTIAIWTSDGGLNNWETQHLFVNFILGGLIGTIVGGALGEIVGIILNSQDYTVSLLSIFYKSKAGMSVGFQHHL